MSTKGGAFKANGGSSVDEPSAGRGQKDDDQDEVIDFDVAMTLAEGFALRDAELLRRLAQ